MPPRGLTLNVIPKDWMDRSDDFEARLLRSGLNGTPVVEAPERSMLGGHNSIAMTELVRRLAGADALGEKVSEFMYERPDSHLARALRSRIACPRKPYPEEALAALAVLLARSVHLDASRSIPLEVLSRLGPEAAELVPLLRDRLDGPPNKSDGAKVESLLTKIEDSIPYFEREPTLRALKAPVTSAVSAAPRLELESVKLRASAPSQLRDQLGLAGALGSLAYGGSHAITLLREAIDGGEAHPLGKLLRACTPEGVALDSPAELSAALLRVLWHYRDPVEPARVRWDLLLEDAGPATAELRARLEAGAAVAPPERPNLRFLAATLEALRRSLPPEAARRLADELVRKNGLIPTEVPALDAVKKTVPRDVLNGRGLCAVQHLFPTLVPLVEACIDKGMDPKAMHILGTPYSSNPLVAAYLRILGVHVMEAEGVGGNTREFEEHRVREIGVFLDEVARSGASPPKGWKILDDGGLLQCAIAGHKEIEGLDAAQLKSLFPPETTDAVEQTTRGLTELDKHPLMYRTVTVANADGKKEEGGIIGWSLAEALLHELRQTGRLQNVHHITLVSAGTVGLATARELRDLGFEVTVVDRDETKRLAAKAAGFSVAPEVADTLGDCDLIYSCTGKTALDGHGLADWDGVIASGSSAAIEYNRDQINALRAEPITELNRGRPMNFSGDGYENLTPAAIGLTRALLFVALTQDTGGGPATRIALDETRDALAVRAWRRSGGDRPEALSLEVASSAAVQRPDLVAGHADHDEWMAYLSSLPRAVCPAPNQVGFKPGLYFFEDEDGQVRSVRTSTKDNRLSSSEATPLSEVPTRLHVLNERSEPEWMIELGRGEDRRVMEVAAQGAGIELGASHEIDRLLRVFREADPSFHPTWGKKESQSVLYAAGDQLLYSFPGSKVLHSRPRELDGPSLYVRFLDHTLVEIQQQPPAIRVRGLLGKGVIEQSFEGYQLPPSFARIDAVVPLNDHGDFALVGRSHEGHLAMAPLAAGPAGQKVSLLPAEAVFRGMHRPSPQTQPFQYVVDYTLPNDPIELEHMRHQTVKLNWSFSSGSI